MLAGDGRLHKAVTLSSRVHIIEELQIFPQGQPVQNLLLDSHGVSGPWSEFDHFDCQQASFSVPCQSKMESYRALASDHKKDMWQNLSGVPWDD
jgi:hypothetical protein